jgi:sugar/nucleoside kinase (ribokinase family)
MSLVIVGSVAFDTIETPGARRDKIVGGSCTYGAVAASYFTRPGIVAVVGEDFPKPTLAFLRRRGVDLEGLKTVPGGLTFHWHGRYGDDPNQRDTLRTDLNVFLDFRPEIPAAYKKAGILFLANIDPDLQEAIFRQVEKPRLTALDTIRLYIDTKPEALRRILRRVDVYFANDEEARLLTGQRNLIRAAEAIRKMGPRIVVVKKGEHGAMVFGPDLVMALPALPCRRVVDPTGAGDSFAGGFLGWLDKAGSFSPQAMRRAAVAGSVMASFTIEGFGLERYKALRPADIAARTAAFQKLVRF